MIKYYGSYQNADDVGTLKDLSNLSWKVYTPDQCVIFESTNFYKGEETKIYLFLRPDKEPTAYKDLYRFLRGERDDSFLDIFNAPAKNAPCVQTISQLVQDLIRPNIAERDILVHISGINEELKPCIAGINEYPCALAFTLHIDEGVDICGGYNSFIFVRVGKQYRRLYYNETTAKLYIKHPETGEYTIPEGIHITKITANKK